MRKGSYHTLFYFFALLYKLYFFFFSGVTKDTSYNRVRFLLECLQDLNEQLQQQNGKLHFIRGDPKLVLEAIHRVKPLEMISFEVVIDLDIFEIIVQY